MLKTLQRVLGFAFEGENRSCDELAAIENHLDGWYEGYRTRMADNREFAIREAKGLEWRKNWLEGGNHD